MLRGWQPRLLLYQAMAFRLCPESKAWPPLPSPRPSWTGHRAALATPQQEKGCTVCGPSPRQTSDIPSARGRPGWEAPTPDRDFPGAPRESGVLFSLCECGRSQCKLPRDVKAWDPHLREVVFPGQPQGIMASKPGGQSSTPCTSPGVGDGDPETWKRRR